MREREYNDRGKRMSCSREGLLKTVHQSLFESQPFIYPDKKKY